MWTLTVQRTADGPLLDVQIGLSASDQLSLRRAGRPVPTPIVCRALLDTGADASVMDPQVLTPLVRSASLQPTQFLYINLSTAGSLQLVPEFAVGMRVPHASGNTRVDLSLRTVFVLERALGTTDFQVLIGRDILDGLLLIYDGPGQCFTLAY